MPLFCRVTDGEITNDVREFDENPNPGPPHVWYPYVREAPPSYDPATHKLGAYTKALVEGQVVASQSTVALTDQEKLEYVIRQRQRDYVAGTMSLKGVRGGAVAGLGFWVDAMIGEMLARGTVQTTEFQALVDLRAQVKADNPKP